jgi:hypothetical protein
MSLLEESVMDTLMSPQINGLIMNTQMSLIMSGLVMNTLMMIFQMIPDPVDMSATMKVSKSKSKN